MRPIRKRELVKQHPAGAVIGPFPSHFKLKEVLKIVRPIFTWCDKASSFKDRAPRKPIPCFYYHLKQCPGACINQISAEEYTQIINHLKLFLRGQTTQVTTDLKAEMNHYSQIQEYEQAQQVRDKLALIKEVTSPSFKLKPNFQLPNLTGSLEHDQLVQLSRVLRNYLDLPAGFVPHRIEGYDVSNILGQQAAVSMVTFVDGAPDKAEYRLFNIKTVPGANDYAMLREALERRQTHPEWGRPDLVVVDGGKGQVRSALLAGDWPCPVIGIAKNPDRLVIPTKRYFPQGSTRLKIEYQLIRLAGDHPALQLIQQLRDEAHRFGKKQHLRLRQKNLLAN